MNIEQKRQPQVKYAIPLGGAFILLALVGFITIVLFLFQLTGSLLDNTRQKQEFEEMLLPVVMFDPVPMSNPEDIEMDRKLLYSMWIVLSSPSAKNYSRNKNETLRVPASDLEVAARNLFGSDFTLTHKTFSDNTQTKYFYDSSVLSYEVPTYGFLSIYKPEVLKIQKVEKDVYKLLVHYIPPDNAWESVYAGKQADSLYAKQMVYVMRKVKDGWNLIAIEELSKDGANLFDASIAPVYEGAVTDNIALGQSDTTTSSPSSKKEESRSDK